MNTRIMLVLAGLCGTMLTGCDDSRTRELEVQLRDAKSWAEVVEREQAAATAQMNATQAELVKLKYSLVMTTSKLKVFQLTHKDSQIRLNEARSQLDDARTKLAEYESAPGWKTWRAWNRVRREMTRNEVADLLGNPPDVVVNIPPAVFAKDYAWGGEGELWGYPNTTTERGGRVWFGIDGKVTGWKVPD